LVLNRNFEPLNVVPVRRAMVLLLKGKAEMIKPADGLALHAARQTLPVPSVVRLMIYAHRPPAKVRLNRRSILLRDDYTCQYCGYQGPGLTVDHVIPRDRGARRTGTISSPAAPAATPRKATARPKRRA
jgi:5-methylcytosine-specific restriction endonuclease McrA